LFSVVLFSAVTVFEKADNTSSEGPRSRTWTTFKSEHGPQWKARRNEDGSIRQIRGGRLLVKGETSESRARSFLKDNLAVFTGNPEQVELGAPRARSNPAGKAVRFTQRYKGVRVRGGEALVNLDSEERVIATTTAFRQLTRVRDLVWRVEENEAVAAGLEAVGVEGDLRGELVVEKALSETKGE